MAGHMWPHQDVSDLLDAKLGDSSLSNELKHAWASPSIGITTVGEFVEVGPSDEMLKNVLGVNSLLGRSRLLRCVTLPRDVYCFAAGRGHAKAAPSLSDPHKLFLFAAVFSRTLPPLPGSNERV